MKVLDLFSGIGGFSLALERCGMQTVAFCEEDPFCTRILNKHWPDVPVYPDIRKLNGKEFGNTVKIISGGFPCQPYSQAGKRKGKEDDRHLWPEYFRIIQEVRPIWVIGENVSGIINMELDQVLSDLESENYSCQPLIIPACAVNAPHRRDRVWIIGRKRDVEHPNSQRCEARKRPLTDNKIQSNRGHIEEDVAYSESGDRHGNEVEQRHGETTPQKISRNGNGVPYRGNRGSTIGGMGNLADGLSAELLDIGRIWEVEPDIPRVTIDKRDRTDKLKALGNAIVPQVVEVIGRMIMRVETGFFFPEKEARFPDEFYVVRNGMKK